MSITSFKFQQNSTKMYKTRNWLLDFLVIKFKYNRKGEQKMRKVKLCCFTVNSTHACIIANNFINSRLDNVKVIYVNEKSEKRKLKNIISKFYKRMDDKVYYTEWLNEKITHDYGNETFVFVVNGKEDFIERVNKYLEINESVGYIINCYDIFDIKKEVKDIINSHDFYINTTGIVKNETSNI